MTSQDILENGLVTFEAFDAGCVGQLLLEDITPDWFGDSNIDLLPIAKEEAIQCQRLEVIGGDDRFFFLDEDAERGFVDSYWDEMDPAGGFGPLSHV